VIRGYALEEVAAAGLAPSVRWLQDQIRAKKIPAHKIGRHWIMTDADVDQMLELTASLPACPNVESLPRLSLTATSLRRQKAAS
jgi:hypothetical protein